MTAPVRDLRERLTAAVRSAVFNGVADAYGCGDPPCCDIEDEVRAIEERLRVAVLPIVEDETTRARAEGAAEALEEIARDTENEGPSYCGGWLFADERSEWYMPHYPDEGWSHCDGCAAAESVDNFTTRYVTHLRARAEALRTEEGTT